jgi:hypothetical protein
VGGVGEFQKSLDKNQRRRYGFFDFADFRVSDR